MRRIYEWSERAARGEKKTTKDNSGGDAPRGNTRSHPEHDG